MTDAATETTTLEATATTATGDATGTNGGNDAGGTITLTQAELQTRIEASLRERLEREEAKRKKSEEKARAEAEEKRLAEAGQHQQVIEAQKARLTELEPLAERVERYEGVIRGYLDSERKGLPVHLLALLDRLGPVEQLEYIAANRDQLRKPAPPNVNDGGSAGKASFDLEAEKAKARKSGLFAGF